MSGKGRHRSLGPFPGRTDNARPTASCGALVIGGRLESLPFVALTYYSILEHLTRPEAVIIDCSNLGLDSRILILSARCLYGSPLARSLFAFPFCAPSRLPYTPPLVSLTSTSSPPTVPSVGVIPHGTHTWCDGPAFDPNAPPTVLASPGRDLPVSSPTFDGVCGRLCTSVLTRPVRHRSPLASGGQGTTSL